MEWNGERTRREIGSGVMLLRRWETGKRCDEDIVDRRQPGAFFLGIEIEMDRRLISQLQRQVNEYTVMAIQATE
jgi:hypothetical protein